MAHSLEVGRTFFGSTTGTLKVLQRLLRVAAASEVIGELFDPIVELFRIQGLERHTDAYGTGPKSEPNTTRSTPHSSIAARTPIALNPMVSTMMLVLK